MVSALHTPEAQRRGARGSAGERPGSPGVLRAPIPSRRTFRTRSQMERPDFSGSFGARVGGKPREWHSMSRGDPPLLFASGRGLAFEASV